MSFQLSPQTILLNIERKLAEITSKLNPELVELERLEQLIITQRPRGGAALTSFFSARGRQQKVVTSIQNQINALNEQRQLLQDEINIRFEINQPTNVNLDTGETSTVIETIDTGGISAIIETIEKKQGVDLKTLAIIGAAILIIT